MNKSLSSFFEDKKVYEKGKSIVASSIEAGKTAFQRQKERHHQVT
jgi:hypothetical protein